MTASQLTAKCDMLISPEALFAPGNVSAVPAAYPE
jgi:hypothetical protein